jgi:hypothetical protein
LGGVDALGFVAIVQAMDTNEIEDPRAPGWRFRIKEVSAGAYRVDGYHTDGRSISRVGGDPEAALSDCVEDAQALPFRRFRS